MSSEEQKGLVVSIMEVMTQEKEGIDLTKLAECMKFVCDFNEISNMGHVSDQTTTNLERNDPDKKPG